MKQRIGILTSGGDTPGMNAGIRAVVMAAENSGLSVMGITKGYAGLIDGRVSRVKVEDVDGIELKGGTILKTARCAEFRTEEGQARAYGTIKKFGIDGLVIIGGNGSFSAGHEFYKKYKVPIVGMPASIDNDINGIDYTIGTDTAINTALDAIDKIRDTATSMERIFVVEVMGRESGFIALTVALAGGCEDVLIPEKELDLDKVCHDIVHGNLVGKMSWIIVVAEGAGKAEEIAQKITEITSLETRAVVLGHVQRGGRPTAVSRDLALNLGKIAVDCLIAGKTDIAVGFVGGKIAEVDFEIAIKKKELKINNLCNLVKILT